MSHLSQIRTGLLALLVVMLLPLLAHAQWRKFIPRKVVKDTSKFWIFQDVSAGPYFTAGVSRQNEDLPGASPDLRWHSTQRFAYAFGGTVDFAISRWIGLDFTALYDTRDLYVGNGGDSDNIDLSLGYLAVQPAIRIFWLLVGLAFDLPMSGSATENLARYQHADQPNTHSYSENVNVPTSDLSALTEVRATLSVPIIQGDDAELYFVVSGSYPLAKTLSGSAPSFDTTGFPTNAPGRFSGHFAPGQGPLPTVEAGISYQFDVLH